MYKLRLTRREKKKLLRLRWLILFLVLCVVGFVVWLAWIRPIQQESNLQSFAECVQAGNPVQESYPEVCVAKNGKRFVNPKQEAAHEASLVEQEILEPPKNPALLNLDIEEWGLRIPLTNDTFDLIYSYVENGESEYVKFTYKRLLRLDVCKGDIGFKMTRSALQRMPPYSAENPAPIANVGKFYFYGTYADKPCYDTANAEQTELVKKIAGDQTLTAATTALVSKMIAAPEQQ